MPTELKSMLDPDAINLKRGCTENKFGINEEEVTIPRVNPRKSFIMMDVLGDSFPVTEFIEHIAAKAVERVFESPFVKEMGLP